MAQLKNLIVNGAARVIGKLKATSIAGDGSEITNINAGNISSGTLPVARGGTGGSDASTARTNLGLATAYSHAGSDTGKALSAGLYKITTSARGHVTAGTAVAKSDITALGIPAQDTVYTHPTSSGNKHIPSGGSSGQILRWSADGTAAWGADNNTTYSASNGISLSGTTFSNSGVRSIATGSSNGTISVNTNGTTANVAVKGLGSAAYTNSNAYAASSHTHSYLPLSGGTMNDQAQIGRSGQSTSWVAGRTYALVKTTSSGSSFYGPIMSVKSYEGSWDVGTYTSNTLHFSYITDTNFNAGTNTQTADIVFKADGSISANTFSGNATTATGVLDYNNTNSTIKIGYSGDSLTTSNAKYFAAYTDGPKIKDLSFASAATIIKNNASGSWGISITGSSASCTGNAGSANYIVSRGTKNPQTGRTQAYGHVYSYNTNASAHTGAPATYTSVIGFGQGTSGTVEIAGGWTAGMGLWYRALRDREDNWYDWVKIYTAKDKPTPSDIGAAASSHTHTKSQITDFPTSLKNPSSLTIKLNGTSQGAYDGSAAKEINITASSVGAAASSHNHAASNITSGTLDAARIPNLAASKITSGTLAVARGGTASGTIGCLSDGQIAYNIGIRAGTSAPAASGTAGLIYIQYA